jgi:hypothetical protein
MTAIRNIEKADVLARTELEDTLAQLQGLYPHSKCKVEIGPVTHRWLNPGESSPAEVENSTMAITQLADHPPRMLIVERYAKDYAYWQNQMQAGIAGGTLSNKIPWHSPARYTMTHEFGHVFSADALGRWNEDTEESYRRVIQIAWDAVGMEHAELDDVPFEWTFRNLFGDAQPLVDDLSGYGALASPQELTAEAFALHHLAPGKSKAAEAVYEYLASQYHEAHKTHGGYPGRVPA